MENTSQSYSFMPAAFGLLLAIAAAEMLPNTVTLAATEQEIFEDVFGKDMPHGVMTVPVPLILNGTAHGPIDVRPPDSDNPLRVRASALRNYARAILLVDMQDRIAGAADRDDFVSGDHLSSMGLYVFFDQQTVELHIDIPVEMQKASQLALNNHQAPFPASLAVATSPVSSYLNMRVAADHIDTSSTSVDEQRSVVRIGLEHALRVDDWVMELDGNYTESYENRWQRGDFRLVHDDPQHMLRYSIGDLSYPVTGFQRYQAMAGMTIARNFSLQPYRVTQPVAEADFLLKSPARVDILVNDRVVRTLDLDAGRHNIRDFPFTSGLNYVSLRITDELGRSQIIEQPFLFDSRLLTPGLNEYSLSIGYPSVINSGKYSYDTDLPGASLFLREGISRTLTLGGNLQANRHQYLIGAESLVATRIGTFHADVALSQVDAVGNDHRARLEYRYYDAAAISGIDQRWTGYIEYTGNSFATLGDLIPANAVSYEAGASYSQRLGPRTSGGLAAVWQQGREPYPDSRVVNVFVSRALAPFITTRLNVERRLSSDDHETSAFMSLVWSPRDRRQSVNASFDTVGRTSRIAWQQEPEYSVADTGLSLGTEQSAIDRRAFGRAAYSGYRGEAAVSGEYVNATDGAATQTTASVQFGTAAVYAAGHVALSRPVSDSFVMVVPHKNLQDVVVGVDPAGNRYAARSDHLGAGVVPNLPSYLAHRINVVSPDLPPGRDLGQESFVVLPAYKSGTVIEVGTNATVMLGGVLRDTNGNPLPLQAGEILAPGKPQWLPRTLFTNRKGVFRVEGMEPGNYELRLFDQTRDIIRFTIPDGSSGFYDAGPLTAGTTGEAPSA